MKYIDHLTASGMKLTTELEAARVQSDTTARRIVANAGYTSKAMVQGAVSMAENLNLPADATARAMVAAQDARKAFDSLGVGAKDLAKLEAVTGARAGDMAEIFNKLQNEFQIKDLKAFEKALIQSGAATRDIGGQANFLKASLKHLSAAYSLGEKDIQKYGISILKTSAGFRNFTGSTEEARQLALDLTSALLKSREGFQGLMAGTETDLDSFRTELAVMNQNVDTAFSLMNKGPQEFVEEWIKIGAAMDKTDPMFQKRLQFIQSRLSKAVGPELTATLVNIMKGGQDAADLFLKSMDKMPGSIKEVNKAFTTGFTLQDRLELMGKQMIAKFRQISTAGKDFVKAVQPEFKRFGEDLTKMAAMDGPVGGLVKKMADMHKIGAMALVPKDLRPTVAAYAQLASSLKPVIDNISEIGHSLFSLSGPFELATKGLFFLAFRLKQNEARLGSQTAAFEATKKEVADFVKDGISQFKSWIAAGPAFFDFLFGLFSDIKKIIIDSWPTIKPELLILWGKINDAFDNAWTEIKPALKTALAEAWDWAVTKAWPEIKSTFDEVWPKIELAAQEALRTMTRSIASFFWTELKAGIKEQSIEGLKGTAEAVFKYGSVQNLTNQVAGFGLDTASGFFDESVTQPSFYPHPPAGQAAPIAPTVGPPSAMQKLPVGKEALSKMYQELSETKDINEDQRTLLSKIEEHLRELAGKSVTSNRPTPRWRVPKTAQSGSVQSAEIDTLPSGNPFMR